MQSRAWCEPRDVEESQRSHSVMGDRYPRSQHVADRPTALISASVSFFRLARAQRIRTGVSAVLTDY